MSEKDRDRLDLAKLLADIGTLNDDELGDAVSDLLDSPDVADTLEGLRKHVDDLFERLDSDPQPASAQSTESDAFESHVEALGRKMDATSALLAELTDVLKSQTERIETIEEQLGDPDFAYVEEPERAVLEAEAAIEQQRAGSARSSNYAQSETDETDETDPNDVFREFLNERLDRIESRVSDIESRITDVKELALSRDGRMRSLEERVVSLLEAGRERRRTAARVTVFGHARQREAGVEAAVSVAAQSAVTAGASCDGPLQRAGTIDALPVEPVAVTVPDPGSDFLPGSGPVSEPAPEPVPEPVTARVTAPVDGPIPDPALGTVGRPVPESALQPALGPAAEPAAGPAQQAAQLLGTRTSSKAGTQLGEGRGRGAPTSDPISPRDRLAELVEREVRTRREFTEGAVQSGALGHPTIMVVDDSADARTILSIYLSRAGYNVVAATSAEDCLARLRHHSVDAIVLDARMPGADGSHVCRMLQEDVGLARFRDLPVIVYTAYPDEYPRAVVEKWGATEYLVKGGDMLPLITALVRHTGVDAVKL